jgi:P27 family predicted phage terminase small subunit
VRLGDFNKMDPLMPGRKRKPVALKKLTGSDTKTMRGPAGGKEVSAPGRPTRPDWIGKDAAEIWDRAFAVAPWLAAADEFKLAAFVQAMADLKWAVIAIETDGRIVSSKQGDVPHPAIGIKTKAITAIAKFGSDLGFDPATRAKLAAPQEEGNRDGSEFFDEPTMKIA